jgi:hypothetical protein
MQEYGQWFRNRPDVVVLSPHKEKPLIYLHCEVKPSGARRHKIAWDLLRLVRYARCSLSRGLHAACLLQVVGRHTRYMRVTSEDGMFVLREIGTIQLPMVRDDLDALAAKCGVLFQLGVRFVLSDPSPPAHVAHVDPSNAHSNPSLL